ncbi:MAG: hypothetical protein JEZ14_23830 [Marinilabiliaceae bacterium]|nr:hypothetical protein [Marinilabiliaceae bacterium]
MIKTLIGLLLCSSTLITMGENEFNSTNNTKELDLINAYNLKIENVKLFGSVNSQIEIFGLPNQVLQHNKEVKFKTIEEVFNVIEGSIDYTTVCYTGIEFWCFNDLESIPCKIDFRKLEKKVLNGSVIFSDEYELNDFKKDYPNSFTNRPQMPQSFFEMATQEKSEGLKHYFVQRSTKSDPNVKLLIEFTFQDDKLIYMFFANF